MLWVQKTLMFASDWISKTHLNQTSECKKSPKCVFFVKYIYSFILSLGSSHTIIGVTGVSGSTADDEL